MADDPPEGTQHVPDGPLAPSTPPSAAPTDTQHVADLPRFGRFRAIAELGAGAMGTVFSALDDVLGRAVAIKVLSAKDTSTRQRFLREARAISAVRHPNVLAVFDAGSDGDTPYLVMELAAGGSLRDRLRAGPLPVETVRELGIQIARALAAAHAANILHRDIKPANILSASELWKLADFGIARLPDSTLTVEGQFLGSPSYAAPESLRAGEFSPASDVYGLGATLYEALAGAPPYGEHDMRAVVRRLEADPPPLSTHRSVPAALEAAIMATLARDPAKRPTADTLAHLLAATGDHRAAPRAPSKRTRALALALAAIAIVLLVVAATRSRGGPLDARAPAPAPAPRDPPDAQAEPQPQVVDQYGNPVDDETAKQILEQMRRDAESQLPRHGRKHGKHGQPDD